MCEFVCTLCLRTIWPVLLAVLFLRVSPFSGLISARKAVFLELLLFAAIIVCHVFSLTFVADLRILCAASRAHRSR